VLYNFLYNEQQYRYITELQARIVQCRFANTLPVLCFIHISCRSMLSRRIIKRAKIEVKRDGDMLDCAECKCTLDSVKAFCVN
jgi:hypothetical protein